MIFNKKLTIYLDHAASTPVLPEVIKSMQSYWADCFANPSSEHLAGFQAKQVVEGARKKIADILGVEAEEIIFTGSGTESINLGLLGVARANSSSGKHVITSCLEHQAVLQTFQELSAQGFEVTYLPVDNQGQVSLENLVKAVRSDTILVSLAWANNETGTIQPISDLVKAVKKINPQTLFHTDACQCPSLMQVLPRELGVDLLSLNGSKIAGPKGMGLLYCRKNTAILPIVFGGGQENNLRSGTENVSGIVGLATALKIAQANSSKEAKRLASLRDKLEQELIKIGFRQVITSVPRLVNNLFLLAPVESKGLLEKLSQNGLFISRGSACSSKKNQASDILLALGYTLAEASSGLRFSLGWTTTEREVNQAIKIVKKVLA